MNVTGSRVAGIVEPLKTRLEKAAGWKNWKMVALTAAAFAAGMLGGVGMGASWAVDRYKNSVVTNDKKKVLADYYREQIATQLGIDPSQVNVNTLEMAARVNPMFANMLNKVKAESTNDNRSLIMGTALGAAAGSWVPGVGAISNAAAKATVHAAAQIGGAVAGGMAASFFNKDVLFTQDVAEHIDAKIKQGEPITSFDVMLLRIAQDEGMQAAIKKHGGKALHKMNEAEQRAVLATMPGFYDAAERDAEAVNQGRITQQDLLVVSPGAVQQQTNWAQRVGGRPRAARGSFTQAVDASRGGKLQLG